ncbi:uncharacterized protein LOC109717924 isoform X1 [Ananas comosus]|uniref:Uncharacterized protein LOC109717924 isoform X1 n=1 Tax=Ananas comosus TaxID=4615 RepID=A0A6P5FUY2_ANACO|nr:uncharacterized protein LOC109717924 isoform X1 [Ananas comosus]
MALASLSLFSPPPPPPPPKTLTAIQNSGVIACLRAHDGKTAMDAASAALRGGISVLEIVMSTPGVLEEQSISSLCGCQMVSAQIFLFNLMDDSDKNDKIATTERSRQIEATLKVIKDLRKDHPSLTFGVGTILNVEDARKAVKAGAQFLMSPCSVTEILLELEGSEILYIPGVMTPTEVLLAYNAGAKIVKVYPVSLLGGEKYISALKKPFPHVPMVASQGVTTESIGRYIEAGASAVVLSDAIFDKGAMQQRSFDEIERLASCAVLQANQAIK